MGMLHTLKQRAKKKGFSLKRINGEIVVTNKERDKTYEFKTVSETEVFVRKLVRK